MGRLTVSKQLSALREDRVHQGDVGTQVDDPYCH